MNDYDRGVQDMIDVMTTYLDHLQYKLEKDQDVRNEIEQIIHHFNQQK